jgi:hypothetical protein
MSRSLRALVPVALTFVALASVGCSSGADDTLEEGGQAVTAACEPAKYEEAFGHYRKAVYGAKARQNNAQVCDEEGGAAANGTEYSLYLASILDEASAAVMICGQFRDVIKNSPYAEPLRKEIGDSLTLKSLTGELLVIRDSQWQNWSNVEAFLPGTTMWSPAHHGYDATIAFQANGKAKVTKLEWLDAEPYYKWTESDATYTVVKAGADRDKRKVKVTHDGVTETFDLKVFTWDTESWTAAPLFELAPENTADPYHEESFISTYGECGG